jgi:hypothetical protein
VNGSAWPAVTAGASKKEELPCAKTADLRKNRTIAVKTQRERSLFTRETPIIRRRVIVPEV